MSDTKTYANMMDEQRRLRILLLLAESNQYTASVELLHTVLSSMGHAVSHEKLGDDLEWLADTGLAGLERIADVPLARITVLGMDVARGLTNMPGVARPGPG